MHPSNSVVDFSAKTFIFEKNLSLKHSETKRGQFTLNEELFEFGLKCNCDCDTWWMAYDAWWMNDE